MGDAREGGGHDTDRPQRHRGAAGPHLRGCGEAGEGNHRGRGHASGRGAAGRRRMPRAASAARIRGERSMMGDHVKEMLTRARGGKPALAEYYAANFAAFIKAAWRYALRPDEKLVWSWCYDLWAEYLTQVAAGAC